MVWRGKRAREKRAMIDAFDGAAALGCFFAVQVPFFWLSRAPAGDARGTRSNRLTAIVKRRRAKKERESRGAFHSFSSAEKRSKERKEATEAKKSGESRGFFPFFSNRLLTSFPLSPPLRSRRFLPTARMVFFAAKVRFERKIASKRAAAAALAVSLFLSDRRD